MRSGKLSPELLERLLSGLHRSDPRVQIGPRIGEDAAAIDLGNTTLVVTTDPITFVTEQAGWYALQVNANDIAAMGAEPVWFAVTILLPPAATESQVVDLFAQLRSACDALDVSVVTGHTEVTPAVTRTVIVGTMLGTVANGGVISSAGALPGDAVLLAGSPGVEGTAILATEARLALVEAGFTEAELQAAATLIHDPGVSVVSASKIIRSVTRPHAMHDATEGGVATALREVAMASGTGMRLWAASVPFLDITRRFCVALGIEPLGLISSGCLIAVVEAAVAERVTAALSRAGIVTAVIGTVEPGSQIVLGHGSEWTALPEFERDELARYFEVRAAV